MSLYQCERCGCRENTSLGRYHSRFMDIWSKDNRGLALCSACSPVTYDGGKPVADSYVYGRWHGKFRRVFLPKGAYKTDHGGDLVRKDTGRYHQEDEREQEYP